MSLLPSFSGLAVPWWIGCEPACRRPCERQGVGGDPDGGIAPGTQFEEIPEDWVCPVCGVGKDMFEEVAE